jgi:hypothetical protein
LSAQAGGATGAAGVVGQPGADGAVGTGAVASATPNSGTAGSNSALPDTTSPTPEAPMGASGPLATLAQNIKLWGYGEVYYMNPVHNRERAQADLARAVFGISSTSPPTSTACSVTRRDTHHSQHLARGWAQLPRRHAVLKLDYQHFLINNDFTRVDLGLGLNF